MGISIEYLAGFFDGEGNITTQDMGLRLDGKRRRPAFTLRLCQSGADGRKVLRAIARIYGGTAAMHSPAGRRANRKDHYQWWVCGSQAFVLAEFMAPHLHVKKAKVLKALEKYRSAYT